MSDYKPTAEEMADLWALRGFRWNQFMDWVAQHDADIRADERERVLAPILELARKFDSEGDGEALLYTLAAGRIRAATRGEDAQ